MPLTDAQRQFLARVKAAAVALAEPKGVPASVSVGQAILESGWGRSGLARKANALHGIKARGGWTGPVYSGTTREAVGRTGSMTIPGKNRVYPNKAAALADGCAEGAIFRAYASFEDSVADHAQFFHENSRYHGALRAYATNKDPFEFATLIWKAGYATARDYGPNLHNYMRQYAADLLPGIAEPLTIRVVVGGNPLPANMVTLHEGWVFVHVRAMERLGHTVKWDAEQKAVEVT